MADPSSQPNASRPVEPEDPLLGKTLGGRFTVVSRIGQGGMGRVYRALQSPLDRSVALKVLNPHYQVEQDPAFAKRFILEASVTARLTHPNTITLFDYGRTDEGVFFIAMELLQGKTLHQVIAAEGPQSPGRVVHIAKQICRSLREAHKLGIVHRDLKPANVMLVSHGDDDDFVKVLDFGLVKFFDGPTASPDEGELTQGGVFMGSPTYMAPEQAQNIADPRSDVYSLAIVCYHLLTGQPPFKGKAPVDIILKHVNEQPPQFKPELGIPADLEAVIFRALMKSPDDRYQSMEELLDAFKRCAVGAESSSRPNTGAVPVYVAGARPPSSHGMPLVRPPSSGARPITAAAMAALRSLSGEAPVPEGLPSGPPSRPSTGRQIAVGAAAAVVVAGLLIGGSHLFGSSTSVRPPVVTQPPEPAPRPKPEPIRIAATRPLLLRSTPEGAEVFREGIRLGQTPLELSWQGEAPPSVTFTLAGHASASVTARLEDDRWLASANLQPVAAPEPQPVVHPTEPAHPVEPKPVVEPKRPTPKGSTGSAPNPAGYKEDPY